MLADPKLTQDIRIKTNELLADVRQDYQNQKRCLSEVTQYLPDDFGFEGKLFFTVGYDIGVSMGKNASLNLAHSTFHQNPKEIWYYCIHEMHHVGYQRYNPFPNLHNIHTGTQLTQLVKYLTFLEGSALYAAWAAREEDNELNEHDYVALANSELMATYVEEYFSILEQLSSLKYAPLTQENWQLIDPLSDGKRLWYRVGALMCRDIDQQLGRKTLLNLIKQGPNAFFSAWETLNQA